jgi:hypothetical protein
VLRSYIHGCSLLGQEEKEGVLNTALSCKGLVTQADHTSVMAGKGVGL